MMKNHNSYQAQDLIYEGKAKKVFTVQGHPDLVWIEFKNSLTAFNALKKGEFAEKGAINRSISSAIFSHLHSKNIKTHWVADLDSDVMIAKKVQIIPLEVVIRNIMAGSTAKKLGLVEGTKLKTPLVEFYYKMDSLADPFLSDDQILMLELATASEIENLKKQALNINEVLVSMWKQAGILLVDFKIEFGKNSKNEILLADEISPDCCRLWDMKTNEKLDKDRFRQDLGNVKESYSEVLSRLKNLKV